jgi:hypothetical protein
LQTFFQIASGGGGVDVAIEYNRFVSLVTATGNYGISWEENAQRLRIRFNEIIGFDDVGGITLSFGTGANQFHIDNEVSDNFLYRPGSYGIFIQDVEQRFRCLRNVAMDDRTPGNMLYTVQVDQNIDGYSLYWENEAPYGQTAFNCTATNNQYYPSLPFNSITSTSVAATQNGLGTGQETAFQAQNTTTATSGVPVQVPPQIVQLGHAYYSGADHSQFSRVGFTPGATPTYSVGFNIDSVDYYPLYFTYNHSTQLMVLATGQGAGLMQFNANAIGLYQTTPTVQPARLGQITDSTGGSPGNTLSAQPSTYNQADLNNAFSTIATYINALELMIHNLGISQ